MKRKQPSTIIHQVASWPLQMALIALVFTSFMIGAASTVILSDMSHRLVALDKSLTEAVRTRDARFNAIDRRLNERTVDRYHASEAAADFARRDEQIELLWRHLDKLERRKR